MRTLSPALRTLPSTRCATPSFCPISWAVAFLPLKENAEVRAATCKPGIFCRTVSNSSLIPSEKYSLPLSSLRLANASTATDLFVIGAAVVGDEAGLAQKRLKASKPAAMTATATTNVANFRGLQVGSLAATSGGTSSVRFRPCGVPSKAQEIITEMTNPKARKMTKAFITQVGASNVGSRIDAAWTSSHATAAYVIATL